MINWIRRDGLALAVIIAIAYVSITYAAQGLADTAEMMLDHNEAINQAYNIDASAHSVCVD